MSIQHVLVAVDGSASANRAASFAAQVAGAFSAKLELLHIYDAPTASALGMEALSREQLAETGRKLAKGSFEAARQAIGATEVEIVERFSLGHPGQEIVAAAESSKADLIVLGNRGRSQVESLLMGSVSGYVTYRANCPVTIVR